MKGKIAVIADEDVASIFRLTGVKDSYVVEHPKQAEELLLNLVKREDLSLVVITERIAEKIETTISQISAKQKYPLIVTVPDTKGPITKRVEPLREIIKGAIGIEIKIG